tara:strand:- start:308 stop:1258 length:951 start_codon:yes stop_codon:yes gene_type:complete
VSFTLAAALTHPIPMSAAKKSQFGKVKPSGVVPAPAPTEASATGKRKRTPLLDDLDISKVIFKDVEPRKNDRHCAFEYDDITRVFIALAKLPNYSKMPFEPNIPKKDGVELGTIMSTCIDLSPEQELKWREVEAKLNKFVLKHKNECYPPEKEPTKKGISDEVCLSRFRSTIKDADPSKGWPAKLKVRVLHEDGKQPRVEKLTLIETPDGQPNKCTYPEPGSYKDLKANCAGAFEVSCRGGPFFGPLGYGIALTLESAALFTNLQGSSGPGIDYEDVVFVKPGEATANGAADADEGSADDEDGSGQFGDEGDYPPP